MAKAEINCFELLYVGQEWSEVRLLYNYDKFFSLFFTRKSQSVFYVAAYPIVLCGISLQDYARPCVPPATRPWDNAYIVISSSDKASADSEAILIARLRDLGQPKSRTTAEGMRGGELACERQQGTADRRADGVCKAVGARRGA